MLVLSVILTILTALAARRIARGRPLPVRLLAALSIVALFVWLSPQVYYGYYLFLFDGLPLQIVVAAPPSLSRIIRLLTFTGPSTLSAHGIALLGWFLLAIAALQR